MARSPHYRIGQGWDRHRIAPDPEKPLVLGGVTIPEIEFSLIAHSDGDVVLHALTDAILGALGEPDIGEIFPNTDPQWEGASSDQFLAAALQVMRRRGGRVGNVDITIVTDHVRVSPLKADFTASIARLLGCEASRVNVKGKTTEIEAVSIADGEAGIECQTVILLEMEEES